MQHHIYDSTVAMISNSSQNLWYHYLMSTQHWHYDIIVLALRHYDVVVLLHGNTICTDIMISQCRSTDTMISLCWYIYLWHDEYNIKCRLLYHEIPGFQTVSRAGNNALRVFSALQLLMGSSLPFSDRLTAVWAAGLPTSNCHIRAGTSWWSRWWPETCQWGSCILSRGRISTCRAQSDPFMIFR